MFTVIFDPLIFIKYQSFVLTSFNFGVLKQYFVHSYEPALNSIIVQPRRCIVSDFLPIGLPEDEMCPPGNNIAECEFAQLRIRMRFPEDINRLVSARPGRGNTVIPFDLKMFYPLLPAQLRHIHSMYEYDGPGLHIYTPWNG